MRYLNFLTKYIFSFLYFLNMVTFGLFSSKWRTVLHKFVTMCGFRDCKRYKIIPVVSAEKLLGDEWNIKLQSLKTNEGNTTFLELAILAEAANKLGYGGIFEIGTFDVRTTLNFAVNTEPTTKIVTLDLPANELGNVKNPLEKGEEKFVIKSSSGERFIGT